MSPDLDQSAAQHPAASSIVEVVRAEGGRVTFARFMEIALTHPRLGYYTRVERLGRRRGDFLTAPVISPFFNRTVARLVTELVDASRATGPVERPGVVEFGGGEGHLAEAVLRHWEAERSEWRAEMEYRIVEVGALLRQRQEAVLRHLAIAGWKVGWGADVDEACVGTQPVVVMGNEFLDALPVHLVRVDGTALREAYVQTADGGFAEAWGDVSDAAAAEIESLLGTVDARRLSAYTQDGFLEVRSSLGPLIRRVTSLMPSGSLVTIDYGDWFTGLPGEGGNRRAENPAKRRRTLRGYFRHQMVADPLARPGSQDLTADVDFAALDHHGRREGFETVVFATLAAFLRGGGGEDELRRLRGRDADSASDPLEADRQATALANLLNEEDLGGAFKVMVQVRE